MFRSRRNVLAGPCKLDYSLSTLIMLAGISGLMVMLCRVACHGTSGFMPKTLDWNRQRTMWMDQHPALKQRAGERPRIMMVTGSSLRTCESAASSHAILQSAKNKLDYTRLHDIQLYYSLGNPEPNPKSTVDWWVTLPLIRTLLFQHPEVSCVFQYQLEIDLSNRWNIPSAFCKITCHGT